MTTCSNRRSLAALSLVLLFAPAASGDDRPNVVLIFCDDLGYADVGFNGGKDVKTPNLDALAAGGTICSSGYVAHPFCGPSRMALMAGRYPHLFGGPYNLPNAGAGIDQYNALGLPVGEATLAATLQKAGYRTGAVGKWHMGVSAPYHPNARGFDEFYGFLGGGHMYFPERYRPIYERQKANGTEVFNEYIVPLERNGEEVVETEYLTDALSREAVQFVEESADGDAPFFLYLSYNAPHTPLEAKEEDLALFEQIRNEKRRTYAAMVYAVDRGVGELVDALKARDELEDTLIVFLSDNGGKLGAGADNTPLKQGKGSVYEGGVRVPMFWSQPGTVPAGRVYEHPVSAIDFYPTFAGLAQTEAPEDQALEGVDVWDALLAGRPARDGDPIYAVRYYRGFGNVGIRRGPWKIVKVGSQSGWQLFDVTRDVGETKDVSADHPEVVKSLVAEAETWSRSHVKPLWFHTEKAGQDWEETDMPNYNRTFSTGLPR
ncbi:sulfatase-like hydrolase/transferase [Alienimonas chondri]|uniref:Arylsulfatase n=1 Tax=Alienimonas chondri TaxID=2681879 RepID=A0ABX1VFP2_9PLAN|nr:sulfatase-like hydrolase/transferase [Alienimonas chondri]NNJ26345.1 Arylsulfatase [Alienimonas chondri]